MKMVRNKIYVLFTSTAYHLRLSHETILQRLQKTKKKRQMLSRNLFGIMYMMCGVVKTNEHQTDWEYDTKKMR